MDASRRGFLGFLCAPAIIRVADLMPIKELALYAPKMPSIDFSFHWIGEYENITEQVMMTALRANKTILEDNLSKNNALYRRLKLKDAGDKWIK